MRLLVDLALRCGSQAVGGSAVCGCLRVSGGPRVAPSVGSRGARGSHAALCVGKRERVGCPSDACVSSGPGVWGEAKWTLANRVMRQPGHERSEPAA